MAQVLGILKTPAETAHAVHELRRAGFEELEVYSPCPSHEIEEALDRGPSIVRLYTLIGCLTGVTFAYFMQIWMAYDWPVVIGGKPYASIAAYTIIGFELNILFGGILTVIGLLIHGMWKGSRRDHSAYQPSFSGDEFGCLVDCSPDRIGRVQELLRGAGSAEVRVVTS
jgi:ActD protein